MIILMISTALRQIMDWHLREPGQKKLIFSQNLCVADDVNIGNDTTDSQVQKEQEPSILRLIP